MTATRVEARAAVAAFFQPRAVAGLNYIFDTPPRSTQLPPGVYLTGQSVGTRSGVVGIIDILRSSETRRAMGGAHGGVKRVEYEIELKLLMRSTRTKPHDVMADLDAVIDATVAHLRSDHLLATDGITVWQAAEALLDVETVVQRHQNNVTEAEVPVRFDISQFVNA